MPAASSSEQSGDDCRAACAPTASYLLFASGDEGCASARDPGTGGTRGFVHDAALHALEPGGHRGRDSVAGWTTDRRRGPPSPLRGYGGQPSHGIAGEGWSGLRGSNPCPRLGKPLYYHCTKPARRPTLYRPLDATINAAKVRLKPDPTYEGMWIPERFSAVSASSAFNVVGVAASARRNPPSRPPSPSSSSTAAGRAHRRGAPAPRP